MEDKKQRIDGFTKSLVVAKGHCLKSLLDFADLLKDNKARGSKPTSEKDKAIEEVKRRIHNDIAQFAETAILLIALAKSGGKVEPYSDNEK